LKFWKFEIWNVHSLNFQSFRISHFWNYEIVFSVFNRLLSSHIFYHQLIFIRWVLWKSFVKMSFFNDKIFHFQKSLIKPKLKIGSNGFLIRVFWHSCLLKRNNVPWLPWFPMKKKKTLVFHGIIWHPMPFVAPLIVFWPIWIKKKTPIDTCFNSFNHTKGILKHHGFVWNSEYSNVIAYSQKQFDNPNYCVPFKNFQIYMGTIFLQMSIHCVPRGSQCVYFSHYVFQRGYYLIGIMWRSFSFLTLILLFWN
jgi:hypothetical protein